MTSTPDLIAALSANLTPVRRLRPPLVRAFMWLMLAVFVLALIGTGHGLRPNLSMYLANIIFLVGLSASLLTGAFAAIAAFFVSLPDRSRLWAMLPVPTLVVWLASIGHQCLTNWIDVGPEGMKLGETAECFATLGLTSLPLSLALVLMLRYAAPLRPTRVILLGSLAVAGITASALSLFHALDATAMVLMFNLGTALLILGAGTVLNFALSASDKAPKIAKNIS
jgi:hypothetical protein